MRKTISLKQGIQGLLSLGVNVKWDELDGEDFQRRVIEDPIRAGEELTRFLKNGARVQVVGYHVIDCDAIPFLLEDWKVESHRKGGQVVWDPTNVVLYLDEAQQNRRLIEGNNLRKKLAKMPVMNANVLDYLLDHPELIPEEWKGIYVYFWGTIYRSRLGGLGVRCLRWDGDRWNWNCRWLGNDWDSSDPVAVSAN